MDLFPPTLQAAYGRAKSVRPSAYAKTRNYLDGAVTRLSPYITHGFISIPECTSQLENSSQLSFDDKLIYEFAWREYFQHVWSKLGDRIFDNIRPPIWAGAYQEEIPEDIRTGSTGIPVIDMAVRQLYCTGYLHNHVRMWLASYTVHIRKVSWQAGARWMYSYLLDGDLASNNLSWQWIAGTFSHKPYIFNSENVARYAPEWTSPNTIIDQSYLELEAIARGQNDTGPEPGLHAKVAEPKLYELPPGSCFDTGIKARADTHSLSAHSRLIHPWDLGSEAQNAMRKQAVIDVRFHAHFPWSEQRWMFVMKRLGELVSEVWLINGEDLPKIFESKSLTGLNTLATLNPHYKDWSDTPGIEKIDMHRLLINPEILQNSFSRFYQEARKVGLQLGYNMNITIGDKSVAG